MGCGMSTEDKEGKARNEEIENQLKRDKMMQRNEIKMLLLGMRALSLYPRAGFALGRTINNVLNRCWRVRKIDYSQADEADPRGQLLPR